MKKAILVGILAATTAAGAYAQSKPKATMTGPGASTAPTTVVKAPADTNTVAADTTKKKHGGIARGVWNAASYVFGGSTEYNVGLEGRTTSKMPLVLHGGIEKPIDSKGRFTWFADAGLNLLRNQPPKTEQTIVGYTQGANGADPEPIYATTTTTPAKLHSTINAGIGTKWPTGVKNLSVVGNVYGGVANNLPSTENPNKAEANFGGFAGAAYNIVGSNAARIDANAGVGYSKATGTSLNAGVTFHLNVRQVLRNAKQARAVKNGMAPRP